VAGLTVATMLAMSWTQVRTEVIASTHDRAISAAA
jgi:hypothetical protein